MPERAKRIDTRPPRKTDTRDHAAKRGYNYRWQRFRLTFLQTHPLCAECRRQGIVTEATELHHLDGLGPLGARGYDENNLEQLCKTCHSRKTASQ